MLSIFNKLSWRLDILEKKIVIFWCDFIFIYLTIFATVILRSAISYDIFLYREYFTIIFIYTMIAMVLFYILDLYNIFVIDFWSSVLPRIYVGVSLTVLFIIVNSFYHEPIALPRMSIINMTIVMVVGLSFIRYYLMVVHRSPLKVMIVGAGITSLKIIEDLQHPGSDFFRIIGVYNADDEHKGTKVREIEIRGTVETFLKDIEVDTPQIVVVSFEHELTPAWTDALLKCGRKNINVYSAADVYGKLFGKVPSDHIDAIWLLGGMNNIRKPYLIFKRLFDIFSSIIGLTVMGVLFPFLYVLMKFTSPGPIFFSQNRVGLVGKNFKIYKFRTMIVNAEKGTGAVWCTEQDKRITPLGRFMRKVRIDELPQFWNILKGDMSLIGPRPERPEFVEMLKSRIPFYDERHLVKPGLTGWAQVSFPYGNSVEDSTQKLHYDLYYIRNMSIFLDMKIALKTVATILEAKGGM